LLTKILNSIESKKILLEKVADFMGIDNFLERKA
jgi:hypothetical protein